MIKSLFSLPTGRVSGDTLSSVDITDPNANCSSIVNKRKQKRIQLNFINHEFTMGRRVRHESVTLH